MGPQSCSAADLTANKACIKTSQLELVSRVSIQAAFPGYLKHWVAGGKHPLASTVPVNAFVLF